VEQFVEQIVAFVQENWQQLQGAYEEWILQASRVCGQSQTCTRITQLVDTIQNTDDFARLVAEPLVRLLQRSHRLVARSQGKLIRNLPFQFNLTQFVPQVVQDWLQTTTETVYQIARNLWFNPQNPFTGIWQHLEQIAQELTQTTQWRQVQWERIEQALEQSIQLLVSPSVWASSVRVLIWDPQSGQLQVEIRSPQSLISSQPSASSSILTPIESNNITTGGSFGSFGGIFGSSATAQPSNISGSGSSWFSSGFGSTTATGSVNSVIPRGIRPAGSFAPISNGINTHDRFPLRYRS